MGRLRLLQINRRMELSSCREPPSILDHSTSDNRRRSVDRHIDGHRPGPGLQLIKDICGRGRPCSSRPTQSLFATDPRALAPSVERNELGSFRFQQNGNRSNVFWDT
jgi:hypothetical protein